MKTFRTFFFLISLLAMGQGTAQDNQISDHTQKVSTLDSTLETLYAVISGEKGEQRDWELFRYLFHEEARLIPTRTNEEGITTIVMTPDDYIASSGKWLVENGFFEKEIHRVTQTFGAVTQVFSTYESFRSQADDKPFMRGINSIQLFYNGERWFIMNIFWASESPSLPIPEIYLPGGKS